MFFCYCGFARSGGGRRQRDAWSDYTTAKGPGRHQHGLGPGHPVGSMFGGQASNTFLYFNDLWQFHWPSRSWAELQPDLPDFPGPSFRFGHSAVWDVVSLILSGTHLSETYGCHDTYSSHSNSALPAGQPCLPQGTGAGNLNMDNLWLKTSCQNSHGLPPLDGRRLFVEPDSYQLCSCGGSPDCILAQDLLHCRRALCQPVCTLLHWLEVHRLHLDGSRHLYQPFPDRAE